MASLQPIHEDDIVEVDKNGRRFHALVLGKHPRELVIRPLSPRYVYGTATSHEVINHWRKTKNVRRSRQATGQQD